MTNLVGFDPARIGELAARLNTAADQARGLRASVARIVAEAEDAARAGGYSAAPALTEPDGGALIAITRGAPPMSTDVKTRLKHLLACQSDGLPIDPSLFFNDEKPPDPAKVKAAIAYFNQHIGDDGGFLWSNHAQGAQEVLKNWQQLTPTELDAVINSLTSAQLAKLNAKLNDGASWWGAGGPDTSVQQALAALIYTETGTSAIAKVDQDVPTLVQNMPIGKLGAQGLLSQWKQLTPAQLTAVINTLPAARLETLSSLLAANTPGSENLRIAFANLIYGEVGAKTLAKVDQDVPALQPETSVENVSATLRYQKVAGPLFPRGGVNVKNDIAQGEDGDCWFLSALGTVVMHDPGFLAQHIRENDNGTYTVTFYKNGQPDNITVDGTLPVDDNPDDGSFAGGLVYAHSNTTSAGANSSLWAAIYEKAYAQFRGGYEAIYSGVGATGLADLTGKGATVSDPFRYPLSKVAEVMKSGGVLTAGTAGDSSLWEDSGAPAPLVASHEYMVKSVNTGSNPPTITLMNPWGSGGVDDSQVMPQTVTLTEDQWYQYFDEVSVGKP